MLSAVEKKSLKKIFNAEIKLGRKHFYSRLKKLLVCNTEKPLYISEEIADTLRKYTDFAGKQIKNHYEIKGIIEECRDYLEEHEYVSFADRRLTFIYKTIKIIVVDEDAEFYECSKKYNNFLNLVDNFNHEIGHFLVKNGFVFAHKKARIDKIHLAECAAEAYKALRHKQLFGNDTDFIYSNNFSHNIVGGDSPQHYHDVISQKIEALASDKNLDLTKLSYKDTVKLAGDIALKYSFNAKALKKMVKVYRSVHKYFYETEDNEGANKKCFEIMMANLDNHDVYRAGKLYLEDYDTKKYIDEGDEFWVSAREKMKAFEKESNIILDLGKAVDERLGSKAITVNDIKKLIFKDNKVVRRFSLK